MPLDNTGGTFILYLSIDSTCVSIENNVCSIFGENAKAVAKHLFGYAHFLGAFLYIGDNKVIMIIGVVEITMDAAG